MSIINNEEYLPYDFFDLIDTNPVFTKHIITGDTDSEYVIIPYLNFGKMSHEEIIKEAEIFGNEVNTIILEFNKNFLLPKLGINKEYDFTDFKNELVADGFLTFDAKKNYAYRKIEKNKHTNQYERKIAFKGIATVRTDFSELTKKFLSELIYDVIFNDELTTSDLLKIHAEKIAKKYYSLILKAVDEFDYKIIGKSSKWANDTKDNNNYKILAGKLFNTLIDDNYLVNGSSYLIIPIKIKDKNKFISTISKLIDKSEYYIGSDLKKFEKLTNIGIPYEYTNIDTLRKKMSESTIFIDTEKIIENVIYCETANKITECIKHNNDNND